MVRPGIADGEMYACQLSEVTSSRRWQRAGLVVYGVVRTLEQAVVVTRGDPAAEHLNLAKDPLFTDGPFLVRSEHGSLLMLWSSFGEEGYAMGIARSAIGLITGPWMQQDEPLWARNGGHGMIFTDSHGRQSSRVSLAE